jgi:hypothetical protein
LESPADRRQYVPLERPHLPIVVAAFAAVVATLPSPANAESRWPDERTVGPFVWHADFSLGDHERLVAEVGQLQRDLAELLGIGEPREAVHLFLFAEKASYQAYLKQYFPGVPDRRALFVKGRGPGMVFAYLNRDFEVDLRHESTHALLRAGGIELPLWLDEGLAEYFEAPRDERRSDNPHLHLTRWSARLGRAPRIEVLEAIDNVEQMGRGEYRDAWAWVHFMLHGPPAAREELTQHLAELAAGRPSSRLSERLTRRLPDLQRQFLDHFRAPAE